MSTPSAPPVARAPEISRTPPTPHRHWLRAGWLMTASGWSANQFSALLGAYHRELGLTDATATALFAVYVVGLVPAILLAGPLADRLGRRRVVFAALAASVLATCLLMAGPAALWLLWPGRFLTGVGAGALLTAGSAWIKELSSAPHDTAAPGTAARRSGLFLSAGFASGGLAAALIAQWAPHPMVLAYAPHLVLAIVAALCAARAPETSPFPAATGRESAPDPAAAAARTAFRRFVLPVAPWVFAAPTIAFAVLPGLVDGGLDGRQTAYAGLATAITPGTGILVAPLARRLAARHRLATAAFGLAAITAGLLVAACAAARSGPVVALFAMALLGGGYGLCVAYGLTEVAALAPPHRLARLTARFWALAYLGFFAPYGFTLLSGTLSAPAILTGAAALAVLTLATLGTLARQSVRSAP